MKVFLTIVFLLSCKFLHCSSSGNSSANESSSVNPVSQFNITATTTLPSTSTTWNNTNPATNYSTVTILSSNKTGNATIVPGKTSGISNFSITATTTLPSTSTTWNNTNPATNYSTVTIRSSNWTVNATIGPNRNSEISNITVTPPSWTNTRYNSTGVIMATTVSSLSSTNNLNMKSISVTAASPHLSTTSLNTTSNHTTSNHTTNTSTIYYNSSSVLLAASNLSTISTTSSHKNIMIPGTATTSLSYPSGASDVSEATTSKIGNVATSHIMPSSTTSAFINQANLTVSQNKTTHNATSVANPSKTGTPNTTGMTSDVSKNKSPSPMAPSASTTNILQQRSSSHSKIDTSSIRTSIHGVAGNYATSYSETATSMPPTSEPAVKPELTLTPSNPSASEATMMISPFVMAQSSKTMTKKTTVAKQPATSTPAMKSNLSSQELEATKTVTTKDGPRMYASSQKLDIVTTSAVMTPSLTTQSSTMDRKTITSTKTSDVMTTPMPSSKMKQSSKTSATKTATLWQSPGTMATTMLTSSIMSHLPANTTMTTTAVTWQQSENGSRIVAIWSSTIPSKVNTSSLNVSVKISPKQSLMPSVTSLERSSHSYVQSSVTLVGCSCSGWKYPDNCGAMCCAGGNINATPVCIANSTTISHYLCNVKTKSMECGKVEKCACKGSHVTPFAFIVATLLALANWLS